MRDRDKLSLDHFGEKFSQDAYEALSWVGGYIEEAATVRVTGRLVDALSKEDADLNEIKSFVDRKIREMAAYGAEKSTAPLDNKLRAEELRAWCVAQEVLGGLL